MAERVTYKSEDEGSAITLLAGSPIEAVYLASDTWEEVGRVTVDLTPDVVVVPRGDSPAEPEPTAEVAPAPESLVDAYHAAANIGDIKALATSSEAALALLDLEQASASPRTTLIEWLISEVGASTESPAEPTY